MTVLPTHSQVLVSILVPLVSHFQFSISVRKIRKHKKLKFLFYHSTPKDDLQNQACIVNLHIYTPVLIFSLFYLINTVVILFLCLHSMTSPSSRLLIDFSCLWTLNILGRNHNFILSQRTTIFSLGSHLSYRKAILVGASEAVSAGVWLPLTPLKSTCSSLHYNQWYGAPAWRSAFMACVMMQGKPWYNSVYDILIKFNTLIFEMTYHKERITIFGTEWNTW